MENQVSADRAGNLNHVQWLFNPRFQTFSPLNSGVYLGDTFYDNGITR
jgi:hypothetical protein